MATDWERNNSGDPRFPLTGEEHEELEALAVLLASQGGRDGGIGAVRGFISGSPVCVIVWSSPAGEDVDLRPLAVLVNDTIFDLITPPPGLHEIN